jgi:polyphosphate glucokinase
MAVLGIDIGGSGIKGALVDTDAGTLISERFRLSTPEGAEPEEVAETVAAIVEHFNWHGPVGCGFPAIVKNGTAHSAANISDNWIGIDINKLLSRRTGCHFFVLNDADAAGMAEMRFGIGRKQFEKVIVFLTLGTGIGSAVFLDGQLLPNTEFGHIEIKGEDAETRTSDAARKNEELTWKQWGKRLRRYFRKLEMLLNPNLFIVGGGVSKQFDEFGKYIKIKTPIYQAELMNQAGIIGAAVFAAEEFEK